MATTTTKARAKRASAKGRAKAKKLGLFAHVRNKIGAQYKKLDTQRRGFLQRRPHRSFQMTRRRDYVRSLDVPGYLTFTAYVNKTIRTHWKLFLPMTLLYALIMVALGAITNQDVYTTVSGLLSGAGDELFTGGIGQLAQAGLVTLAAFASNGNGLTPDQGVYLGFSLVFAWLSTVWLLREIIAGRRPKLRDGLYNSGAPILSTVGVILIGVIQMIPIGVVMLAYAGLSSIGVISQGFGAMLFWVFAAVVAALVLYWLTSTIIALVVVTIPGMYPLRAVRLSGDLVVGRRLRILLRLLWGLVGIFVAWAVVLIVSVLVDNLVKTALPDVADISAVPYIAALVTAFSIVWFAAYTYLFYRKVVDDDAKPA